MKKTLIILVNVLVWTSLGVYLTVSLHYTSQRKQEQLCREIHVAILDSAERQFITPSMVKGWFATDKIQLIGKELSSVNTLELAAFIKRRGFVKTARVYTSMDGCLNIEITQRKPIIRFNMQDGYNFYITEDQYILPAQRHFVVYVPVVTGGMDFPFARDFVGPLDAVDKKNEKKVAKNYSFLLKLINFVQFVDSDDFWKSFIVQIRIDASQTDYGDGPDVEIVPRAGNQVILLGSIDDYDQKLAKLLSFYKHAVAYEGWEGCSYINLKYKDQIVCIK